MAMIKKTLITHTYPKPFNIYVDRMFLTDNKSKEIHWPEKINSQEEKKQKNPNW
ncbi:hypothetical protein AAHX40_08320 [Klebsiella pneumoniae]